MMADDSFEDRSAAGSSSAFTDSHIHLVHYALSLANVELDGSSGPEEAAARWDGRWRAPARFVDSRSGVEQEHGLGRSAR